MHEEDSHGQRSIAVMVCHSLATAILFPIVTAFRPPLHTCNLSAVLMLGWPVFGPPLLLW